MTQKYINSEQKILKLPKYPLCLANISGDFSANSMKKTELNRFVYDFSPDYQTYDTSHTINIHKYLMKKHNIK